MRLAVHNTGATVVSFRSVRAPKPFAVRSTTCTGQLAPGESCTVVVTFRPTKKGASSRHLALRGNFPKVIVALAGRGL
jgi:hypothetical protein